MLALDRSRVRVAISLAVGLFVLVPPTGASAVDKPDLVVESVTAPPTEVFPGDSFAVTVVVRNDGTAPTSLPQSQSDNATKFYLVPPAALTPRKTLKGIQIIKTPLAPGERDGQNPGQSVTVAVFSDAATGTYRLLACADGLDFVDEKIENNNCTLAAGTITVKPAPDLVVISVDPPIDTAGQGQTIQVKNKVKNQGAVASAPSTTKYFLLFPDGITTKDLKGPLDPTTGVPALDPDDVFSETELVTIRAETVPGTYRLQACADGAKVLPELDNGNNCASSSATTGKIVVTATPDLVVTSVTVAGAPLTAHPGDALNISTVVTNQGQALANKQTTLKLVLINTAPPHAEKNLKGTLKIPQIANGASATVATLPSAPIEVYSDTPSGTYVVEVCADSASILLEGVESNNCLETTTETITVVGTASSHADLAVTELADVQCSPVACALVVPGNNITATATITNQGIDPVDASPANPLTIAFYLVQGTKQVKNLKALDPSANIITQPIPPGATVIQSMTVEVYSDTPTGTFTLQACADGAKKFPESNENNNCAPPTGSITVNAVPNLVVTSIQNPPTKAALGESFPITIQVKNLGPVATSHPTRTKFNLISLGTPPTTVADLKGPSTPTVPVLGVGAPPFSEVETLTIRTGTPLGQYFLQACVDGDKVETESNENDNCKTSPGKITVTGLPDYVVTEVSVRNAPLQVKLGGTLTVSAKVKNQGIGDASKASFLKFLLVSTTQGGPPPKNLSGTPSIAKLDVGKVASVSNLPVTVFGDTALGTYTVRACADSTDVLLESASGPEGTAETNNCLTTTTTVEVIP